MWQVGFKASAGWDPATGLGTPDFEKLLASQRPTRITVALTLVIHKSLLGTCSRPVGMHSSSTPVYSAKSS